MEKSGWAEEGLKWCWGSDWFSMGSDRFRRLQPNTSTAAHNWLSFKLGAFMVSM